jgi:hypothetical protein
VRGKCGWGGLVGGALVRSRRHRAATQSPDPGNTGVVGSDTSLGMPRRSRVGVRRRNNQENSRIFEKHALNFHLPALNIEGQHKTIGKARFRGAVAVGAARIRRSLRGGRRSLRFGTRRRGDGRGPPPCRVAPNPAVSGRRSLRYGRRSLRYGRRSLRYGRRSLRYGRRSLR